AGRTVEPPVAADVIVVLDFGGQYAQLIARRVREAGVFSLLESPRAPVEALRKLRPRGIILSGGPASVTEASAVRCDRAIFELGVPVLGICYGMQLGYQLLNCDVRGSEKREFGRARLTIQDHGDLFAGVPDSTTVWMSHGDQVTVMDDQFALLASTPTC